MKSSGSLDLTQGKITQKLYLFMAPIFLGNLFQELYTTVDAVVVGQFTGKTGLAAIDAVHALLRLPRNMLFGVATGASIIVAQYFGARKYKDLHEAVSTAFLFALAGGAILSVLGVAAAPLLLRLQSIPDDLYAKSLLYTRIYLAGLFFSMIYNTCAGILRAVGNSRTPTVILIAAGVTNIVLDLLLVAALHMGVGGAALATVLSQAMSAGMAMAALMKAEGAWKLDLRHLDGSMEQLRVIFRLGLPVAGQSCLYPIANMVIQNTVNTMGTDIIAAWAVTGKLDTFVWMVDETLPSATSTFVAQNYGAKQKKRANAGVYVALLWGTVIVGILSVLYYFFSGFLGKIFLDRESWDILPLVAHYMRIFSPFYVTFLPGQLFAGAIQGKGDTLRPMILSMVFMCLSRILYMMFIYPLFGTMEVVALVFPFSWILASSVFTVFWFHTLRKEKMEPSAS